MTPIAADIVKRSKSDKAIKVFEIIEQLVNGKFYGSFTVKFQNGEVVQCEKVESIKV